MDAGVPAADRICEALSSDQMLKSLTSTKSINPLTIK